MAWDFARRLITSFFGALLSATQGSGDKPKRKEKPASSGDEKPKQTSKIDRQPISSFSVGIGEHVPHNEANASHRERGGELWRDGVFRVISLSWKSMIPGGAVVPLEEVEARTNQIYSTKRLDKKLKRYELSLYFHPSIPPDDAFVLTRGKFESGFKRACTVKADMSGLNKHLTRFYGSEGEYVRAELRVVLKWDSDNDCLKAFLRWDEDGVQKSGPETVVPGALCK